VGRRRAAGGVLDTDAVRATGRGVAGAGKGAASAAQGCRRLDQDSAPGRTAAGAAAAEPWKLSIGAIIARHPKAPQLIGSCFRRSTGSVAS
jgi:hypothetical protein